MAKLKHRKINNNVLLLIGDMRERLTEIDKDSIDAIVTDPPYHLTTGKKSGSGPASVNLDSPYGRARIGTGFMGMKWDGGDIAMHPETWAALLRVAKPGAHLVAFGGTRTFHRIWCAIEDAGWEIRDTLMWLYGQGFPKSSNQVGEWEGWGTALKPAFEPIILARKPLVGTVAKNLEQHRVGALNIGSSRIKTTDNLNGGAYTENGQRTESHSLHQGSGMNQPGKTTGSQFEQPPGRWPANVLHDGSEEVVSAFPKSAEQLVDASNSSSSRKTQNVYRTMKRDNGRDGESSADSKNAGDVGFNMRPGIRRSDFGSAARFFWCPKASRKDREVENTHPTVKPTELMRYLIRLVTPKGGIVLDPFMGSGSTGKAAVLEKMRFIGVDTESKYVEIARTRIQKAQNRPRLIRRILRASTATVTNSRTA